MRGGGLRGCGRGLVVGIEFERSEQCPYVELRVRNGVYKYRSVFTWFAL